MDVMRNAAGYYGLTAEGVKHGARAFGLNEEQTKELLVINEESRRRVASLPPTFETPDKHNGAMDLLGNPNQMIFKASLEAKRVKREETNRKSADTRSRNRAAQGQ